MINLLDVEKLAEEAALISKQSLNPEHGNFGKFDIEWKILIWIKAVKSYGVEDFPKALTS